MVSASRVLGVAMVKSKKLIKVSDLKLFRFELDFLMHKAG